MLTVDKVYDGENLELVLKNTNIRYLVVCAFHDLIRFFFVIKFVTSRSWPPLDLCVLFIAKSCFRFHILVNPFKIYTDKIKKLGQSELFLKLI